MLDHYLKADIDRMIRSNTSHQERQDLYKTENIGEFLKKLKVGDKFIRIKREDEELNIEPEEVEVKGIIKIEQKLEAGEIILMEEGDEPFKILLTNGEEININFAYGYINHDKEYIIFKNLKSYLRYFDIKMEEYLKDLEYLIKFIKKYQKIKDKIKEERPELIV